MLRIGSRKGGFTEPVVLRLVKGYLQLELRRQAHAQVKQLHRIAALNVWEMCVRRMEFCHHAEPQNHSVSCKSTFADGLVSQDIPA